MAAAAAVVTAVIKIGTALVAAYKASAVVRAVVMIAAMVGSSMLAKAGAKPSQGRIDQGIEVKLKVDPSMPRQVPVGMTATGGSLVWAFTWTDDPKIPNKYLCRIISLSDFPIDGLEYVDAGGEHLTWNMNPEVQESACTNKFLTKNGEPALYLRVYPGSFTPTADPELISRSAGRWTADHKGVGQAYAIVNFRYDTDAYSQGEPGLTFVVRGAKIYDDRKDDSKPGRTGSHRLNNPASWEWTENTANITAQVLRGFYHNGQLILGAQAEERDLDDGMLVAAYNTCDQLADTLEGTAVKRYRAGVMLSAADTVQSMLEDLSLAMDGNIFDRGGAITMLPGGTRTPVMHLTDDDVIWTEEKSWQPKAEVDSLFNNLTGTYVSLVDGFVEKPFPPLFNSDWEEEDGGERFPRTIQYRAVTYSTQVQRTNRRIHNSSRFQGVVGFVGPLTLLMELEQGDWFTMTSDRWNFVDKYFEIVQITPTADFKCMIVAKETSPVIDGWVPADEEIPDSSDYYNPPDPSLPVPVLEVTATVVQNTDSSLILPAIKVKVLNITENGPGDSIDYEMAYFIGPTLTNARRIASRSADEHEFIQQEGVIPGFLMAVRARLVQAGRSGNWSTWYTQAASGVYVVPDSRKFGGLTPAEWHDVIVDIAAGGEGLGDKIEQMVKDIQWNSEAIFAHVTRNVEDKARFEALTHMPDGVEIAIFSANEREERLTADEAFIQNFNLIGVKSIKGGGQEVWVFDSETAWINEDQSLGEYTQGVISRFDTNEALFNTTVSLITTDIDALGEFQQLLGVKNPGGTAVILNTGTVMIDSDGNTMAQWGNALYTDAVTDSGAYAQSIVATEQTARISGDTAIATSVTTLSATVGGHTTSITQLFSANSALGARWGISLNFGGKINGIVLNSGASGAAFIVDVDSFAVINTVLGVQVAPFAVFGGQVHMTNVVVHTLAADTITANNIIGGAVSTITTNQAGGASMGVVCLNHRHNSSGGKHVIQCPITVAQTGAGVSGVVAYLYRNGIEVAVASIAFAGPFQQTIPLFAFDWPNATVACDYTVICYQTAGSTAGNTVMNSKIIVTELKKSG